MTPKQRLTHRCHLVSALLPFLLLSACGGMGDHREAPPGGPVGTSDNPRTLHLAVDEAKIAGQVSAGAMHLQIPVSNPGSQDAAGSLTVAIVSVDGAKTVATQQVPYAIAPGAGNTLAVDLATLADVTKQADWVRYNLLVTSPDDQELRVMRSLLAVLGNYEVRIDGPTTLTRGRHASYRVATRDPVTYQPLAQTPVQLVVRHDGQVVLTQTGTTSVKGDTVFDVVLDVEGNVTVEAQAVLQGTSVDVSDSANVKPPGNRVLLTTDKPIYQPGQTIHLRALALENVSKKPLAGQPVVFEIADGKGNKICKRSLISDSYGLAATQFTLGQVLNLGTFKVRVAVGADIAEKTVEVSRYVLPKFKVAVSADKPFYTPGAMASGTVAVNYFFGKPVAGGEVQIEASTMDIGETVFQKVVGKTDAQGQFPFSVTLPSQLVGLPINDGNAAVILRVQVTDTAGQKVQQEQALTVARQTLRIALVPEGTVLVPGLDNLIDVFVTDPLGNPAADVAIEVRTADGSVVGSGRSDAYGQYSFTWNPTASATATLSAKATGKDGASANDTFTLKGQAGSDHVLVRTDQAVYGIGDTVTIQVLTSKDENSVYVDWLNNGQTVDMRTLDVTDGSAGFQVTLDTGQLGSNRIEAYVVGADGNIVRAGRTIFVRGQGALTVDMTTDQPQYQPGKPAQITFSVKDESGAPAVAALGVQVVDEAVFAMVDARPGLLRTYFELEDAFSQPSYEIRPPLVDFDSLLYGETAAADKTAAAAAQNRAAAAFAALGEGSITGMQQGSYSGLGTQVATQLAPYYAAAKQDLLATVSQTTNAVIGWLKDEGCNPSEYYCQAKSQAFYALVRTEVAKRLDGWLFDFWGNPYRTEGQSYDVVTLLTSGPDEAAGTDDDKTLTFAINELDLPAETKGDLGMGPIVDGGVAGRDAGVAIPPAFIPGGAGGSASGVPIAINGSGGAGGSTSASGTAGDDEPRVRQSFPETLYVNPALITGADGKASISVDMADSITDWRVSSLAHTAGGKLGGGIGAIRVFQEFFVDIDFPATLTRGDEVSFPIAVYNYLDTEQTVRVELQLGDWFTPLGDVGRDLTLAPGQVTGLRFPVRVDKVGRQSMTVKGTGGTRSDAVARSVLVLPDGQAVPAAISGALAAGTVDNRVSFPAGAVAGSQQLYLNIYPAYLSQVIEGMDSLLRVPGGCFEQTTSTAWPNVLVTAYLKQTKQLKPEIELKAESLMSAGYQRLLTFEHAGGGYSWFGAQDGKPFLSVTAFGLMEFADMAKVQTVDEAMLARTRDWLLGQQSADGSWAGDRSEFFSFHTSLVRNTAFVVWALASAGYTGPALANGLAYVQQNLETEKLDAYSLGIIANAYQSAAPNDATAGKVLEMLLALQKVDGDKVSWDSGGTQTCFYGGGSDADTSATALATYALLLAGGNKDTVDKALTYLASTRDTMGNFGSTQATIWTLRALLLAATKGTDGAVGNLDIAVDGAPFTTLTLTAAQADVMTTVDMSTLAGSGEHDVTLTFAGTGKVSYNLVAQYNVPWASAPGTPSGPLSISVSYDKTRLVLDESATATVVVQNNTASLQNMILVTVGLPPGFQVATEDLDAYKASKVLSAYEMTGKQLMLYLSSLPASSTQTFKYRLQATMPVSASDGGSEVYLYYQPKQRSAAGAVTLQVVEATAI
ncbi:MAG: alpha-2-macroglobulin [Deltaproteobacteria bacterium]|nr:alpha-2-macroglobulin [Deltaproteobacteria bacterium]